MRNLQCSLTIQLTNDSRIANRRGYVAIRYNAWLDSVLHD